MKRITFLLPLCTASFLLGGFIALEQNVITREDVAHAQKLIGLEFTQSETDTMLEDLKEQVGNYEGLRKVTLDNSVPPAILFNPIPPGMEFEKTKYPFTISETGKTEMPVNKNDLAFYSVRQLAELIKNKKITSVELTKFFLERLKKYSPLLYCTVTITEERALKEAKKADEEIAAGKYRGLLHGIPYGAKDLIAAKGYKTTWGSVPYKDQVIDEDATVIKKLGDAGAVLAAKLTLGELAWGDVWFGGTTRTPWDTTRGSSGSSAGSASSVAAGLLPFAIGSETWGSIVSPSTACGATGLRPTYGRVSRAGAMALSWSMDKLGPICRNVEDCAIVFNAIFGPDPKDQTLYDTPFNYNATLGISGMKIGYLKSDFDSISDSTARAMDLSTIKRLKMLGAVLVPIELPKFPVNDLSIILTAEAGAAFDELTRSGRDTLMVRQIRNAWPNTFRASRFIPAVEYIQANRIRTLVIQQMAKMMKENKIDVYISPSFYGSNLLLTNLTGHPCVVLPNGFVKPNRPKSITFIGNLFAEAEVLAVAKAYQDATNFHKQHPTWVK